MSEKERELGLAPHLGICGAIFEISQGCELTLVTDSNSPDVQIGNRNLLVSKLMQRQLQTFFNRLLALKVREPHLGVMVFTIPSVIRGHVFVQILYRTFAWMWRC